MVFAQPELTDATLAAAGAKAVRLAHLAREALPVPPFFVVSSAALARHVHGNGIAWPPPAPRGELPGGWPAVREAVLAAPVPDAVAAAVLEAYEGLVAGTGQPAVAVRSSAAEEDSARASFAGQFSSQLNVTGPAGVLDALRRCWASYLSDRSLRYRAGLGIPMAAAPSFAVILQTQVMARRAGVLFTMHPVDPDSGTAYLEANFGTGESVVGGMVTPDAVTVARAGAEILDVRVGSKRRMTTVAAGGGPSALVDVDAERRATPVLTAAEARDLVRIGLRIEERFGAPQDVEWAYDDRQAWILQSRPLTAAPGSGG